MKSYDQTERRFDRKASFVEKPQETDGLSFSCCGILETSISHQSELPVHNKMHKYASQNMLKILLEIRTYVLYNRDINERKGESAMKERTYIAIDLKSFYASVECVERDLDPLEVNLVVADVTRTEKTICLAVSPALKSYGIPGRARLFEVVQKVAEVNEARRYRSPGGKFQGSSSDQRELRKHPELALDYVTAPPRMALYMEYSRRIYAIYLKYIAPEDIHVYSIDEVFLDVTSYLKTYGLTSEELARKMIREVLHETGITATAGIGTNLYLAKIAMDIMAKHVEPDEDGVRIAKLNERSYREQLWNHRPLTDFWRVGRGYAKKLEENGLYTMGDIARCSMGSAQEFYNEELLYRLFGVNAELLIDHAWGWEPCTMEAIKNYKPSSNSVGSGQVLQCPYSYEKAGLIVREMTELLVLDLVDKGLVTNQIVLTVGYDIENLKQSEFQKNYRGEIKTDRYGRKIPKHAHGTMNLEEYTSSTRRIVDATVELYQRIVDPKLLVRRISLVANHVIQECEIAETDSYEQMDLFTDYQAKEEQKQREKEERERERSMQQAVLELKKKFGKNAVLKGMNLQEGATTIERNRQIGGHKA